MQSLDEKQYKPDEIAPAANEPVKINILEDYKQETITVVFGKTGLVLTGAQTLDLAISLRRAVHSLGKHRASNKQKPIKPTEKAHRGRR